MRKYIAMIVAMIGMSCLAQSAVTNYIYETKIITNNVWTVTNIYVRTQNEITQNVNRVYTYWATNTISFVTNYYFTTNTTHYVTNIIDNIIETNTIIEIHRPVNYYTNITTNYNYNRYIDKVIGTNITVNIVTNYTTEITLDNFEEYVERCENIISNGMISVSNATEEAMLYAYICNEAAQRLASTNAIVFSTNSIPLPDYQGYTDRLFQLACNNLNGSFMAKSAGTAGYNIYATSIYAVKMGSRVVRMYLSHVTQNEYGFEVCYFPIDNSLFISGTSYYIPGRMTWRYNCSSNILDVYEFNNHGTFIKKHQCRSFSALYPTAYGMNVSDSVSSTSGWTQMAPSLSIGGSLRPFYFKTSSYNPSYTSIFAPMFPSLDTWKYMWWLTNVTGEHIR